MIKHEEFDAVEDKCLNLAEAQRINQIEASKPNCGMLKQQFYICPTGFKICLICERFVQVKEDEIVDLVTLVAFILFQQTNCSLNLKNATGLNGYC